MASILEGVLEGDVFLGELAVEVGSVCVRGYRRRRCCLTGIGPIFLRLKKSF